MFKRRYAVLILALLAIKLSLTPGFAGVGTAGIPVKGYGYTSGLVAGTNQVVKNGAGLIYDITLLAGSSTSTVTVYDTNANTLYASGPTNTVWELEASTANTSTTISFANAPIATSNGIEVSTANSGLAILNYQ